MRSGVCDEPQVSTRCRPMREVVTFGFDLGAVGVPLAVVARVDAS